MREIDGCDYPLALRCGILALVLALVARWAMVQGGLGWAILPALLALIYARKAWRRFKGNRGLWDAFRFPVWLFFDWGWGRKLKTAGAKLWGFASDRDYGKRRY